jgi:hypothetical protein
VLLAGRDGNDAFIAKLDSKGEMLWMRTIATTGVDTANGIAVRRSPREWMFPNVDLTIHLHRQPTGDWVGLDTTVIFGTGGHGLTSTVLHDVLGPVGQASQTLTVRPLP